LCTYFSYNEGDSIAAEDTANNNMNLINNNNMEDGGDFEQSPESEVTNYVETVNLGLIEQQLIDSSPAAVTAYNLGVSNIPVLYSTCISLAPAAVDRRESPLL
jgi:hypothetical protein